MRKNDRKYKRETNFAKVNENGDYFVIKKNVILRTTLDKRKCKISLFCTVQSSITNL